MVGRLGVYYEILQKWNPRLHLVSSCSPEEFAVRHVLESLWILRYLPDGSRIIDIGSGGGLPIVPCLITRDDLTATLIESSQRKSVFLREALRLGGAPERVILTVVDGEVRYRKGDFEWHEQLCKKAASARRRMLDAGPAAVVVAARR